MNKENILAVADAIEKHSVKELGFNMHSVVSPSGASIQDRSGYDCGTVACIMGWSFALRTGHSPKWDDSVLSGQEAEWLGLTDTQRRQLFFGPGVGFTNDELKAVEQEQAVATMRNLAKTGEVDWSAS